MPRIHNGPVAQRIRYPNGTSSDPFLAPMRRADMQRFAIRIRDGIWPEKFPDKPYKDEHTFTNAMLEEVRAYKYKIDPFWSGSSRLACAHDGRFWRTAEVWMQRVHDYEVRVGHDLDNPERRLTTGELGLLFARDDEFGWHALSALGFTDPQKALARTVIAWVPQIEEWSDPRVT